MTIQQKVTRSVEIGELDATERLPVSPRNVAGMRTVCRACGCDIKDEFFIVGFKRGLDNLILHEDCAK